MKKDKGIKIIKGKSASDNNYTFIDNINTAKTNDVSSTSMKEKVGGNEQPLKITIDSKEEEKYKNKKDIIKNESDKKFKALRFSNPSQRNHSSVYE
jgi:hypothetical protein